MQATTVVRGDLLFLWHPKTECYFSGYGLALEDGRRDQLVGLLMVDRPVPASEGWLISVGLAFGEFSLYAMTVAGERGMTCHMHIEAASLAYVRKLDMPKTAHMRQALQPLLAEPPKPRFLMQWDPRRELWASKFDREEVAQQDRQGAFNPAWPKLRPLFALGQIVATPGALAALVEAGQTPEELIARHVTGDWGALPPEDIAENARALKYGNRLFSSYRLSNATKLWVITEHDRSVTTLLRPEDY